MYDLKLALIKNSKIVDSSEGLSKKIFLIALSNGYFINNRKNSKAYMDNSNYFLQSDHIRWIDNNDIFELKVLYSEI